MKMNMSVEDAGEVSREEKDLLLCSVACCGQASTVPSSPHGQKLLSVLPQALSQLSPAVRHFWGRDSPGTVHDGSLASCTSTALQQLALLSNEPNLHPFREGPCLNLEEGRWQWAFTQMLYLSIWSDMHLILAKS